VVAGAKGGGLGDPVGEIYGLHGWPTLTVGTVATRVGPLLASVDDFKVTVRGTQAHGAYPHQGHDAILAASHMITMLQSIASRNVGPLDSVVVSVGAINAGTADNIIPETCTFIGTVRTLTPEIKKLARERFYAIIENVAKAMHVDAKIHWDDSYPVTINDEGATATFLETARSVLPEEKVITLSVPTMGGEDFSYYGRHVPACFFFLGLKPIGAARYPALHQPDFDFNDAAIPLGVELFCRLALR
jgi:amidohydrolase